MATQSKNCKHYMLTSGQGVKIHILISGSRLRIGIVTSGVGGKNRDCILISGLLLLGWALRGCLFLAIVLVKMTNIGSLCRSIVNPLKPESSHRACFLTEPLLDVTQCFLLFDQVPI